MTSKLSQKYPPGPLFYILFVSPSEANFNPNFLGLLVNPVCPFSCNLEFEYALMLGLFNCCKIP